MDVNNTLQLNAATKECHLLNTFEVHGNEKDDFKNLTKRFTEIETENAEENLSYVVQNLSVNTSPRLIIPGPEANESKESIERFLDFKSDEHEIEMKLQEEIVTNVDVTSTILSNSKNESLSIFPGPENKTNITKESTVRFTGCNSVGQKVEMRSSFEECNANINIFNTILPNAVMNGNDTLHMFLGHENERHNKGEELIKAYTGFNCEGREVGVQSSKESSSNMDGINIASPNVDTTEDEQPIVSQMNENKSCDNEELSKCFSDFKSEEQEVKMGHGEEKITKIDVASTFPSNSLELQETLESNKSKKPACKNVLTEVSSSERGSKSEPTKQYPGNQNKNGNRIRSRFAQLYQITQRKLKRNMIVKSKKITYIDMDIIIDSGDFVVNNGDVTIHNGDLVVKNGNFIVNNGRVTINDGDIIISNGNITLNNGKVVISNGEISSNGDFTNNNGDLVINNF